MWIKLLACLAGAVLAAASSIAADLQTTNLDNTLLALALTEHYPDGGYYVVEPRTGRMLSESDAKSADSIKKNLTNFKEPRDTNDPVVLLVDQLLARNYEYETLEGVKKSVRLTIPSSLKDGYVVDYDRKYAKYFEPDGGHWPRFYKENPKARGKIIISLPAYDSKSGLVLIFKATSTTDLRVGGK